MKYSIFISLVVFPLWVLAQGNNSDTTKKYSLGIYTSAEYPIITNTTENFKKGESLSYSIGVQNRFLMKDNIPISFSAGYICLNFKKKYHGELNSWDIDNVSFSYKAISCRTQIGLIQLLNNWAGFGVNIHYAFDKENDMKGDNIPFHLINLASYSKTQFIYVPELFWEIAILKKVSLEFSLEYYMNNDLFIFFEDAQDDFINSGNGLTFKTRLLWSIK